MKHALLTALALIGLTAFAPRAEAGSYVRVFQGYDHCGRAVYSTVYRPSSSCGPSYHRTYSAPRSYSSSYGYRGSSYQRDHCSSSHRGYSSGPRFSIRFGF